MKTIIKKLILSALSLLLLSLGIYAQNAPTFTSTPITSATQDIAYSYTATAEDIDGDYLWFNAPVLPLWMDFDTGTHVLSGIPTNSDVGMHDVTLTVSDGVNLVEQNFSFTVANVNDAPALIEIGDQSTDEGVALIGLTVSFTDIDPGDTHTISVVSGEPNVTVENLSGHTSGSTYDLVPQAEYTGTAQITVTVTDNGTGTLFDSETYTLTVNAVNNIPSVVTHGPSTVYATQIVVTGEVSDEGPSPVTDRGICLSLSPNPDLSDNVNHEGSGPGFFTSQYTYLTPSTTYYYRAFATNSEGTAYGEVMMVTTMSSPLILTETITQISCYGADDGSIETSVSGGLPPYTYSWSNEATTPNISSLSPGIYSVFIYDAEFNEIAGTFEIIEPSEIELNAIVSDVETCNGHATGSIQINPTGGTPPYLTEWEHGPTGVYVSDLEAGTYDVLVTDANNCEQTASFDVLEPDSITIQVVSVSHETCVGCDDGTIVAAAFGGTPPYTFYWTGPDGYSSVGALGTIAGLSSGDYYLVVYDINACATDSLHVYVGNALVVTNIDDSGPGSLRQAIIDANINPGMDFIQFNIPGDWVHTIRPATLLPSITDPLVINGFSQPGSVMNSNPAGTGFNTEPKIELDGSSAGDPATGLIVIADSCEISGLIVNQYSNRGIALWGNHNSVVECFIGTDSMGYSSLDYGNRACGIEMDSADNNVVHNCIISANGGTEPNPGISIQWGSTLNQITGNLIGTNITGMIATPNSGAGIGLTDSPGNTIGGINAEDRNIIYGGINLTGANTTGNKIIGNYLGPDITGQTALGQGGGISITDASNNEVGPGNVISGNIDHGLHFTGQNTSNNRVFGNYFGLAADGNTPMGNQNRNIVIESAPNNRIGGLTSDSLNVISASVNEDGILIFGAHAYGNQIVGNYIGTNASGDQAVGNAQRGVIIAAEATNNIIGPNNVISGNDNWGIQIYHITATNNRVINNFIGTDATGAQPLDNGQANVYITNSPGNLVDGNTICGAGGGQPGGPGIELLGVDTWNTVISNNFIGTNAMGDQGLGNGSVGIVAYKGASNNNIGPNNVISGNGGGIEFFGAETDSMHVFGNYIGTNQSDAADIGNMYSGINITDSSAFNTIGPGNVISNNGDYGIQINTQGAIYNRIIGNLIGTTGDGMSALGNDEFGILCEAPYTTIGGLLEEERNVVSANSPGIVIGSDNGSGNCIIQGNYIGTDITGNGALLNEGTGLNLNNSTSNLVGGLEPGARNVIGSMGIANLAATNNKVIGNYIGIRADGSGPIDNSVVRAGILISDAADNTIGPGNVISGVSDGIMITEYFGVDTVYTINNKVYGNFIGTNPDGTVAVPNGVGLQIEAKKNLIGGYTEEERNIISGNDIGVNIFGEEADSNIVVGNYIGTDYLGETAIPNNNGVWITDGNDNMIGGVTEESRNIISGNNDNGIWIQGNGPLIADGNKVQGNFIGLAANGTDPLGNGGFGVKLNAAAGNLIGGPEPKHRNIVSANGTPGMNRFGIYIEFENSGIGNTIQGNYVGTDVTGMLDVGNVSAGILINDASNINILDNLVSGNGGGIVLWQGEPFEPARNYENIISGNIIGLNSDASGLLGNDYEGIAINRSRNNIIGGESPEEGNIIGGNEGVGLSLSYTATGNMVLNNYIGYDPVNRRAIPNSSGIRIDENATNNQIGDLNGNGNYIAYNENTGVYIWSAKNTLLGNSIWGNGAHGVHIFGEMSNDSYGNTLSQNLIFDNGLMGIDLNGDGPTPNDVPLDPDIGPNLLQNYPELDSIKFAEGKVKVTGKLRTKSDSTYIVEFFSSNMADGTGYGEGEYYLGSDTVRTDEFGNATFQTTLATKGYGAQVITATATDEDGNTSEFSQAIGGVINQALPNMPFEYTLNNEGLPTVPLADYQNAIHSAFQTWDEISGAEIGMEDIGSSDARYASATDNINLVTFQDDHFPFSTGVLAVTAKTIEISASGTEAEILDADIVFNPAYIEHPSHPFAVLEEGSTDTMSFDIQTVATHEIGHVLGMIHSGVYNAKMFFMLGFGTTGRDLEADDMAWAAYRYQDEDYHLYYGMVSGRVTYGDLGDPAVPSSHPPVAGALVLAIDTLTQEMFHAYTDADGNYTIPIYMDGTGSGLYWIYIQPLDGDVYGTALRPANISPYIYSHTIFTDFPEEFYDDEESYNDNPRHGDFIAVTAGSTVSGIDLITNRDQTPPEVLATSLDEQSVDIAVSPTIVMKFSESVDLYSFDETTCYVEQGGTALGGEYTILADSTHIMLMKPVEALEYSTEYTLHITGITDLKGNVLAVPYSNSFTTQEPDLIAPYVYDVIPADSLEQVDVTKPVKVFFSEPMNKSSAESGFNLLTSDSSLVEGDFDWNLENKEMTFTPDFSLSEGTAYIIGLSATVSDLSDNPMEQDTSFTFSTVDVAAPQIVYLGPGDGNSGITVTTPVVVKFTEPLDVSTISSSSFYLTLTAETGLVNGTYEYLDDNRTIVFRPDQDLQFNESYTIYLSSDISDISNPKQYLQDTTVTFQTAPATVVPHIAYMDPPFGAIGAQTTIVGSGFDPVPSNNVVSFDGVPANVSKATLESVTVLVPINAESGPVTVSVNGIAADNTFEFDVVPPNTDPSYSVIASANTGSRTRAVIINPEAAIAYVTNWGDNTVTPIDISGNVPVPGEDIQVGVEPMDIDLNSEGTLAFVSNFLSNTVSVIGTDQANTDSLHKVVNEIQVGYHPYGVAASADKKVYVANNESEYVSVIDMDPNSGGFDHVIANVKTGSSNRSLVVTPNAVLVLVTGDNGVAIIDRDPVSPTFNDVIARASAGSSTRHVTFTPDAALALATTEDGVILIIDIYLPAGTNFGKAIASVKTGSSARNITFSPDAQYVYITNPDENTVSVYQLDYSIVPGYGASLSNPQGLELITTIDVDNAPYAIIGHPNSDYILVTHDSDEGGVSKITVKEAELDPIETLEELIASVQDARDEGLIRYWLGSTLLFNLNQTLNRVHLDLPLAAIISLDKFIRKVQRNMLWGRIPSDLGEAWLETAYMIREQLLKDYQEKLSQLKGSGEEGYGAGSGVGALDDPQSFSGNEKDPVGINSLKLENRPNPFSNNTLISFEIPDNSEASVPVLMKVYNTSGQVIKTLVHMNMEPGRYSIRWNGDLEQGGLAPNGIYLLELTVPDQRKAIRLSVIK